MRHILCLLLMAITLTLSGQELKKNENYVKGVESPDYAKKQIMPFAEHKGHLYGSVSTDNGFMLFKAPVGGTFKVISEVRLKDLNLAPMLKFNYKTVINNYIYMFFTDFLNGANNSKTIAAGQVLIFDLQGKFKEHKIFAPYKTTQYAEGNVHISSDGSKILYQRPDFYVVANPDLSPHINGLCDFKKNASIIDSDISNSGIPYFLCKEEPSIYSRSFDAPIIKYFLAWFNSKGEVSTLNLETGNFLSLFASAFNNNDTLYVASSGILIEDEKKVGAVMLVVVDMGTGKILHSEFSKVSSQQIYKDEPEYESVEQKTEYERLFALQPADMAFSEKEIGIAFEVSMLTKINYVNGYGLYPSGSKGSAIVAFDKMYKLKWAQRVERGMGASGAGSLVVNNGKLVLTVLEKDIVDHVSIYTNNSSKGSKTNAIIALVLDNNGAIIKKHVIIDNISPNAGVLESDGKLIIAFTKDKMRRCISLE